MWSFAFSEIGSSLLISYAKALDFRLEQSWVAFVALDTDLALAEGRGFACVFGRCRGGLPGGGAASG